MKAYARLAMFAAVVISLYQPTLLLAEKPVTDNRPVSAVLSPALRELLSAKKPTADKVTWIRNLYNGV